MLQPYTLFSDTRLQASGTLPQVARAAKCAQDERSVLLVFDNHEGRVVDLDLRGDQEQIRAANPGREAVVALEAPVADKVPRGRGRPKLGVVAREVTLLPRHWSWIRAQSGSASAVLRRLVELEMKRSEGERSIKAAQARAHAFMGALLADQSGYDEAMRALYAPDPERFAELVSDWPKDLREHLLALAAPDTEILQ